MNYTSQQLKAKTAIFKNKEIISYADGYAIMDQCGNCFMIVYGEDKRD